MLLCPDIIKSSSCGLNIFIIFKGIKLRKPLIKGSIFSFIDSYVIYSITLFTYFCFLSSVIGMLFPSLHNSIISTLLLEFLDAHVKYNSKDSSILLSSKLFKDS